MIKKSEDMRAEIRPNMRDGKGDVTVIHLLEKEDMMGKSRLAARMIVPVGGSVGDHVHDPDAEIYIVVSGTALLDDNGTKQILNAGDAAFAGGGEYHSVANAGDIPLEIIAIVIL